MKQSYGLRRLSPGALVMVLLAHAGVVVSLSAVRQATPPEPLPALMVEVITPEKPPAPPKPDITPPKPKPMAKREQPVRVAPIPVLAAKPTPTQPAVNEVVVPPPAPLPPIQAPPPPPQPVAPVAVAAPPAPPAKPVPPRFDADYLNNPKPIYPALSQRMGEKGTVKFNVYVEPNGTAGKVELLSSSGSDRLDKAARTAVLRWRFTPGRLGNEAVGAWVIVPVEFENPNILQ